MTALRRIAPSPDTHPGRLRFLLGSAAALASTTVLTSGLGFLYWIVAARAFDADSVGISSTAISAMNLIAPLAILGFGTLLVTELPLMSGDRARVVAAAAAVSALVAAVTAVLCALVLPNSFIGLRGVGVDPAITALFAAAAATQAVGLLLDSALLSMVGGVYQLGRNAIQAVVKLALLAMFAFTATSSSGSLAIFASWFLANVISIVAAVILLMRAYRLSISGIIPSTRALRGLHFAAARHHLLNITLMVPFFAMPIVTNVTLGPETAGRFYIVWSAAGLLFYLPLALSTALFASGARGSRTFLGEFRFTLRASLLICAAANLALLALGGVVLNWVGAGFADQGRVALSIIALGGFGLVIKDHHVAWARVNNTVGREGLIIAALTAVELAGGVIGAHRGGITGLSIGWALAVGFAALVCAPLVWKIYQGKLPEPSTEEQLR